MARTAAARKAEERRKNLIALTIAAAIVAMVTALAIWPSMLAGPSMGALAASVGGSDPAFDGHESHGRCFDADADAYLCRIAYGSSDTRTYRVEVDWRGCWTATPARDRDGPFTNCVNALDYVLAD